jgi:hypothetical protein
VKREKVNVKREKEIVKRKKQNVKTEKERERELQEKEKERERERELEREKMKLENERAERENELRERESQRQFELEKLRLLNKKEVSPVRSEFDAAKNIRLVPKFQEKAVDEYFPKFEKVAENLKWPKKYWSTLLQSVLIEKAAQVYSSLAIADSSDYDKVKAAILTLSSWCRKLIGRSFDGTCIRNLTIRKKESSNVSESKSSSTSIPSHRSIVVLRPVLGQAVLKDPLM